MQSNEPQHSDEPMLLAAYRLPVPVVAESEALGLQVRSRFGGATVDVRVSVRQDEDEELDADDYEANRARRGDIAILETGAIADDWHSEDAAEAGAHSLRRLLIGVMGPNDALGEPRSGVSSDLTARLADELFRSANVWHDVFRSWIEVATAQDLDHVHPRWDAELEGGGLATFTPEGERFGHGGIVRFHNHDVTPATGNEVTTAIVAAGEPRYPPLAHQLLRDARAAWYRGQSRRAVIDAATATEIALTALVDKAGANPLGKVLMLGRLVDVARASGLLFPEWCDELMRLVVRPRNKAVHEGAEPDAWDAAEACKAAQLVVFAAFRSASRDHDIGP
jgi:hypothetical protein